MSLLRTPVFHLQGLLILALVLGGGGIVYGWRHMAIELAALLVLAANRAAVSGFLARQTGWLRWLALATVLAPLLQAVQLPPALWQALPGRGLVLEAYAASGIAAGSWFSYSLDPMRTLAAFCATLVPLALIVVGARLAPRHRVLLAWTLVACAALALLLGAVQLSSGNGVGVLQDMNPEPGVFYATFSNRNTTGLFFVIVALLLVALPWPPTVQGLAVASTGVSLALLAVLLTQSRSAIALIGVVVVFGGLRLLAGWRQRRQREGKGIKGGLVAGVILAVMAAAAVVSATGHGRLAAAAERFSQIDGNRLEMWEDGAYVARRYWPAGAGTGIFDEVFQVDESLEYVSPGRAGRAHNDYLELVIELGLPGLALLVAWLVWLGQACWRRRRDPDHWLAFAAYAACIAIGLQSALDYPLRNHAMLALAGLLVVFLLPPRADDAEAAA